MKWIVAIGILCWFAGMTLAGVLKEEETLGVAGFQHLGSLSEIVCLSDGVHVLSSSRDGDVGLWEIESGELIRKFTKEKSGSMWGMALLPGEKEFLVATGADEVIRFELATGKELMTYQHPDDVLRIVVHPDGGHFVATDDDNFAIMWELESGKEIRRFKGHTGRVCTAIFVEEGRRLVTGSSDDSIKTWDVETGKCMETSEKIYQDVYTLALSPQGKHFAMASGDRFIRVFNAKTRMEDWKVKLGGKGQVVSWSPDGKLVAVAAADRHLYLFDSKTGEEVRKIKVADSSHVPITFSKDGKTLISGGDQHLHLHDVSSGRRIVPGLGIPLAPNGFDLLTVGPKGRMIYASLDDRFYAWNRDEKGKPVKVQEGNTIYALAASPNGEVTGLGLEDGTVRIRGVSNREIKRDLKTGSEVSSLIFSPTGRSVISGGKDGRVAQWALGNGGMIRNFRGHQGKVNDLAVEPGGKRFASASADGSIRIWSLRRKIPLSRMTVPELKPSSLAIFGESKTVLSSFGDKDGNHQMSVWGGLLPDEKKKVELNKELVDALVQKIAADKFETRQLATDELVAMGEDVLAYLAEIKAGDPEVAIRIEGVRERVLGKGGGDEMTVLHSFNTSLKMIVGDPGGRYWAGTVGSGKSARIVLGEIAGKKLKIIEELGNDHQALKVAFSADGKTLVSSNEDGTLTIYSVGQE